MSPADGSGARASITALLTFISACGGIQPPAGPGGGAEAWLLYVANQDDATISVIDTGTRRVLRTIDLQELGFGAMAKPHHIVAEPDGSHWYVSLIGENQVLKFDASDRLVGSASFEVPGMLAMDPVGDGLFVGRSMSAVSPPRRIGVIQRSDMSVEEMDVFFPRPHALTVRPDGSAVLVGSLGVNQFAVVNPGADEIELVDVDGPHHTLVQFAISPDGRSLVVTGEMTGRLLVFDSSVPMAPIETREVEVGQRPWHPVFTPDGGHVYLGNKGSNTVSVVDTGSWREVAILQSEGLDQPHGSAVTPDGRWVFISSNGSDGERGTVVVIDTAGPSIVDVIEVGRNAAGIGLRSAQ